MQHTRLVVRPPGRWSMPRLADLWEFRDLFLRFSARDVTLRYRQTALGVIWVVLTPLLSAGVFTFVFHNVADIQAPVNYFAFSYAGMLGWNLFNNTVTKFSVSLTANAGLVSKIYFPRLVLPLSTLGSTLLDFGVAIVVMAGICIAFGIAPGIALLLLPFWVVLAIMLGGGIGLMAGALMVPYRDVAQVLGLAMQLALYGSPVAYGLSTVTGRWAHDFLALNPLTGIFEGFRWSILDVGSPGATPIISAVVCSIAAFVVGIVVFTRMERQFADVI